MSYSKVSGSINNSILTNVDFENACLDSALLCKAEIKRCDFQKSKPVINVDDAVCEASHFVKAKFVAGSSGIEYGGRRVRFVDCDFTGTVFDRVEFRATKYINCTFTDAKLKKCDFRGVKFEGGILPITTQFENMYIPSQFILFRK
ncbi:pentapeptide repeat-containing protein [Pantoea ananatis]|uniref:pentapeptide repeat-containing protein n=1 Tax=Pantoea ananas TaxID=553 RepID=UPI000CF4B2CF|nr:pentapeptide repeat-containing protein [Pantoea ananatis]PQK96001.1 hypothetical protein CG433_04210 [Pantoea ananatis]